MPKLDSNGKQEKGKHAKEKLLPVPLNDLTTLKYSEVKAWHYWGKDAITVKQMKEFLGWETEKEYIARMIKLYPYRKDEPFPEPDYIITDNNKERIICWNVDRNRPFDESHCKKLSQTLLNRNYAGPTTMEGETVNGESFIIGRYARVLSGQHRGIALVLAWQLWKSGPESIHWQELWPKEEYPNGPVLETVLVTGISESPQVVRTLDNVKPRSLFDVIYTSEIFRKLKGTEKKECCRMLAKAVDLLWKRTGQSDRVINPYHAYGTHTESLLFIDRHPKLVQCVRHLFDCNKDRAITTLDLSPGYCSAMLYLMGSCNSNREAYWQQEQPEEKVLVWDMWGKSKEFWTTLGKDQIPAVRERMALLTDPDNPGMGNTTAKLVVIARAWELYKKGERITVKDLRVDTQEGVDGKPVVTDDTTFGGIDSLPVKRTKKELARNDPTPEQLAAIHEARKEEIERQNGQSAKKAERKKGVKTT